MKKICLMVIVLCVALCSTVYGENYTDLTEAQNALHANLERAKALGDCMMESAIRERLKAAIIVADAVDDSNDRNDINKINAVMPELLLALENAEKSVEQYSPLEKFIDAFRENELANIQLVMEDLEAQYEDSPEMWKSIVSAINDYENKLWILVYDLKNNWCTLEMLNASQSGKTMREILKENSIEFPTLEDVINSTTFINDVKFMSEKNEEYGLSGQKISDNYKGIVIKAGKKVLRK